MRITGKVAKTERRSGDFTNDRGEKIAYDFTIVRVLTEEGDVQDVRIPANRSHIRVPQKGEEVSYSLSVPNGTRVLVEEELSSLTV